MEDKNEKKVGRMSIDDMIALYHIVDEFDEFNAKLNDNLKSKTDDEPRYFINKLSMVSWGETVIGWKNAKTFYKQYKNIIDTINKYSRIDLFAQYNYLDSCNSCISDFYNYLIKYKDRLKDILTILYKLKELEFEYVFFNETLDFTNKTYLLYDNTINNLNIYYLDNMEAIPNYRNDVVKYKTTNSNYKIILSFLPSRNDFVEYSIGIQLNSFLFNIDRLPSEITKDIIIEEIKKLKKVKKDSCISITNSINLNISIEDMYMQFLKTCGVIDKLENFENKEELKQSLKEIKEALNKMHNISMQYDKSISMETNNITPEQLVKEKKMCLASRYNQELGID